MIAFEQLELQKRELVQRIEGWPKTGLSFHPAPQSWSAIEILDHLVKTETSILAASRRGFEHPTRIGLRDRLGVRFIYKVFESERRVKVPAAAKAVLPSTDQQLGAVLQRWEDGRRDLGQCMADVVPEQLRGGVFRHPVGGWMSFGDVVDFFSVHMIHHGFQLTRIERDFEKSRQPSGTA